MHKVFEGWSGDYLVFPSKELTPLFEGFELLGALAYIGLGTDEETLAAAVSGSSFADSYVWAPMGRASWDGQTCRKIFEEWQRVDVKAALIAAGFARKSGAYLDKAIKSLENLASRLRW
jgi:hypothetical protein